MSEPLLMGVDLGTSMVKATLFDTEGNALAHTARGVAIHQPAPGVAEQDPDELYGAALACVAELCRRADVEPSRVAAMGFDGQMGGVLAVDQNWQALTPWYVSTLDARYRPHWLALSADAQARVLALAGAEPILAPRIHWWRRTDPALAQQVAKVLILANYVAGRMADLTAEQAFIDPSYLTWSGLSETGRRCWSPELLELWGVDEAVLPRIVPAATVIGWLSKDAAGRCGLPAGIPLVAGAGDQVAGLVGAGVVAPGQGIDVAGTFPVLAICGEHFLTDTEHGVFQSLAGPLGPDHWYFMTYVAGGGLTHAWFRDRIAPGARPGVKPPADFAALDALAAATPPGAEGLLFVPHMAGRACPPMPEMRGSWVGLGFHHTQAHLYRALLESLAYDYALALGVLREAVPGLDMQAINVIGGGAASTLWTRIKADVLNLRYHRLPHADRATLGSAILAGHAVGIFPDIGEAARRFAQCGTVVAPDPATHARYRDYVAAYGQLLQDLRPTLQQLADIRNRSDETTHS